MPTRIYLTSPGAPFGINDGGPGSFGQSAAGLTDVLGTTTKNTGDAMTSISGATGTVNPQTTAILRVFIGPLAAQTISGTIKGQMRGSESNAGANATLAIGAAVYYPVSGLQRGQLLAVAASDSATAGHELATSLTNRKFEDVNENASITLTSVAALAGDYLVLEIGWRSATGTSRTITLSYGNDSATDLPEDTTTTAANNPWIEFSGDLFPSDSGEWRGVSPRIVRHEINLSY